MLEEHSAPVDDIPLVQVTAACAFLLTVAPWLYDVEQSEPGVDRGWPWRCVQCRGYLADLGVCLPHPPLYPSISTLRSSHDAILKVILTSMWVPCA